MRKGSPLRLREMRTIPRAKILHLCHFCLSRPGEGKAHSVWLEKRRGRNRPSWDRAIGKRGEVSSHSTRFSQPEIKQSRSSLSGTAGSSCPLPSPVRTRRGRRLRGWAARSPASLRSEGQPSTAARSHPHAVLSTAAPATDAFHANHRREAETQVLLLPPCKK